MAGFGSLQTAGDEDKDEFYRVTLAVDRLILGKTPFLRQRNNLATVHQHEAVKERRPLNTRDSDVGRNHRH